VTAVVLAVVNVAVDAAAQRILRLPWRIESSLITSLILLFVLHPTVQPLGLVGVAIAAAVASLSKYVLAWRGRHIFNPAAVGATVLTLITAITGVFALGTSWWWVGTPILGPVVLLLGIVVLWRIEKLRVVALFWVVALAVGVVNLSVQSSLNGQAPDVWSVLWTQLWSSPLLFLGAFMLSEPLTMPPRRWQQLTVAAIVGVLVGWAPAIGTFPVSLGQERALLIGNLIAFLFAVRTAVRLVLVSRAAPTATVRELTFRTTRPLAFAAGQYIELEVPHRRPDARGTRREFSIVSAPEDLPTLRIAFREGGGAVSSFKKALAEGLSYDVVSMGYPGPVRQNKPTRDPMNLGKGWAGFDFAAEFGKPVKVVNDALMQAIGSYEGGRMLFLGLGTGLGAAMVLESVAQPMELAHLPYKKGGSFEDYVGERGLEKRGKKKWRKHVFDVVDRLRAGLQPDYVVIGGGNVDKL
ncbi:MAG: hypothetical protein J0J00_01805, partial [Microbacterium sp.]|nr:hypothetical protein [Microbacterium sp.]